MAPTPIRFPVIQPDAPREHAMRKQCEGQREAGKGHGQRLLGVLVQNQSVLRASGNHPWEVSYRVRDFELHRLRAKDFTYDWCDDHTTVVSLYSQSCAKSHR